MMSDAVLQLLDIQLHVDGLKGMRVLFTPLSLTEY